MSDEPKATTYCDYASAAELETGGRWAKPAPRIAGDPNAAPLPLPPHLIDPCGVEPPLGIDINELPALGGAGGADA